MMDLNKIFAAFDDENASNDETSLLVDFSEHPLYFISGFNKTISTYLFFHEYVNKNFNNIPSQTLENSFELETNDKIIFDKAWDFIKKLDIDKPFHIECIKMKSNDKFIHHLQKTISFFEQHEEYHKCGFLKNLEDKVKEFLT